MLMLLHSEEADLPRVGEMWREYVRGRVVWGEMVPESEVFERSDRCYPSQPCGSKSKASCFLTPTARGAQFAAPSSPL